MSDAVMEEEVQESPPPAPVPAAKPGAAEKAFKEREDQDAISWLQSLGPMGSMKIQLYRVKPEWGTYRGQRIEIEGSCETYDRPISEADIKADYGGGTYDLRVLKPNARGSFEFFRSKRLKIAGPPRMEKHVEDLPPPETAQGSESVTLSQQAMSVVTKVLQEEREKKREPSSDSSLDAIQAATGPLLETIREMRTDLREDRKALAALHAVPPPPAPTDGPATKMLERMLDGSDHRLDTLRTQFESERNQLTTHWQGQVTRAEDAAQRQIAALEKGHERELKGIEKAHDQAMETLKASYGMQIESLKREVSRLERELGAKEKELGEVRGQKTKSLPEQIQEINLLKDLIKGDSDDEEKGSTAERVIDMVINSSPVAAIAARMAAAPGAPQGPTQQQQQDPFAGIPVGQPFAYNGTTMVKAVMPNGQVAVVPLKKKKKATTATPTGQEGEAAPAGVIPVPPDELPKISPEDLALAVTFLESAIQSRTSPKEFAGSIQAMNAQFANLVRKFGADRILGMATISDGSPIVTQRGRTFVREVAEALLAT
jgi:hypothetical protein